MKPKTWTSWRVCPNCGSRATKIFNISVEDKPYSCLLCDHSYNPPEKDCPKKFNRAEKRVVAETTSLIGPLGCEVVGLGSNAVGVLGDARSVGVALVVRIPEGLDIGTVSTMIVNRVKGVARVLLEIGNAEYRPNLPSS